MKLKGKAATDIVKMKVKKHKKLKKYKDEDDLNGAQSMDESIDANLESPESPSSLDNVASIKKKKKLKMKLKAKNDQKRIKSEEEKVKNAPKEVKKTKGKKKDEIKEHKQQLEKLKDIDPEFYKFLKQNDKKLLDFNLYDSDDEDEDDEDNDREKDDKLVHKPSGDLEIASDEEDFEVDKDNDHSDDDADDDDQDDGATDTESKVITLKLLRNWQTKMQEKHVSIDVIRKAIQAFSSALASISGDESKIAEYKVEGSAAFNGVIQLCVLHLQQAVYSFLGITSKSNKPIHKCIKWKKVRNSLRWYFMDLIRLLEHVSSTNILTVLLKHLHQMSSMLGSFSTIAKPILKRLITLWSTSEETVRVLSFLCILKITRGLQGNFLNHVLKAMYLSYVRNSKFVSPNSLPGINFMRRSLVEIFALDLNIAYQHAFLYIRQLAIHLRNAIILKKKDSFQAVYNWQFINSIRLWVDLLGATCYNKPQLQPLIYPLVSIMTGVIKLIPTAQFFPLRFHCIQALIKLSRDTNTFIPILPFILEVLNSNTFNKKHTVVSMKPMQFTCILRLNKSQMAENGFRDEVLENVCGLILEYLANESCSLAFPDLVVPTVMALKQYLKKCKNSNHSRKLKQLLDKIIENSKFIDNERQKINFGLKDVAQIKAWERTMRNNGVPLDIYYQSWVKTHETKKKRQAANTDDINDYDIPVIKKRKINKIAKESDGDVDLFPSDDDDDDGGLIESLKMDVDDDDDDVAETQKEKPKTQKKDKKQKKVKSIADKSMKKQTGEEDEIEDDGVDIVKDLDINDW